MRQDGRVRWHGNRIREGVYRPEGRVRLRAAARRAGNPRRRMVGLLISAALVVTAVVGSGTGAAAPLAAATGSGSPVSVLAPRPGAVIVASTAADARQLRLAATLSITRPVGSVSVQLNGHPVNLPTIQPGRLAVVLDAADGLVLGQNLLWVS